jgi:serine/threonine protein kinase
VTWKCLRHPNIVPFLGIHKDLRVTIISEWMPNGTIASFFGSNPEEHRSSYVRNYFLAVQLVVFTSIPGTANHLRTPVHACFRHHSWRPQAG